MATASEVYVYIAPLPRNYNKDKLYNLFSSYGKILRYKLVSPCNAITAVPAYGLVQFYHPQDAEKAITALNGHVLETDNRRLTVRFASNQHKKANANQQQVDNNHVNKQQHKSNKNNPSSYGNNYYQYNPNILPFKPGNPSNVNNINDQRRKYKQSSQNNDYHRLNQIKQQILYYFSVAKINGCIMRRAMDKDGWIKIDTILKFDRMKSMRVTKDEIIKIGNMSTTIEIKKYENKIRTVYWKAYIPRYELQQQQSNKIMTDLQKENKRKDQLIEQLMLKEQSVCIARNKLKDEYKGLEMKYDKLEIKYNEKIKKLDYRLWDALDIVNWIINLDKLRYNKYYNVLLQNMIKEGVDGGCLNDINKNDLHRMGVKRFNDKRDIYHNLQQLIDNKDALKNKKKQNNDENEGVLNNTVFI